MADTKIWDMIPDSLKPQLLKEVKEIIAEDELASKNKKIDPDVLAFIKNKKQNGKK